MIGAKRFLVSFFAWTFAVSCLAVTVHANAYREKGKTVAIAGSTMTVTPPRDWNRLSEKPGKKAETWTLDGEQLNDITFYVGISDGEPLIRERNKKQKPLPKFTRQTLLVELPELLENTLRTERGIGTFKITGSRSDQFLQRAGIRFTYEYIDADELPRKGEARAVIVASGLYMIAFAAPRTHFFDRGLGDYRALSDTAKLS